MIWNTPGEAYINTHLQVEGLALLERSDGTEGFWASAFYERDGQRKRARPLPTSALVKPAKQSTRAAAATALNYADRFGSHAEPVAFLSNQLLRDLGYAVNLTDLRVLL